MSDSFTPFSKKIDSFVAHSFSIYFAKRPSLTNLYKESLFNFRYSAAGTPFEAAGATRWWFPEIRYAATAEAACLEWACPKCPTVDAVTVEACEVDSTANVFHHAAGPRLSAATTVAGLRALNTSARAATEGRTSAGRTGRWKWGWKTIGQDTFAAQWTSEWTFNEKGTLWTTLTGSGSSSSRRWRSFERRTTFPTFRMAFGSPRNKIKVANLS